MLRAELFSARTLFANCSMSAFSFYWLRQILPKKPLSLWWKHHAEWIEAARRDVFIVKRHLAPGVIGNKALLFLLILITESLTRGLLTVHIVVFCQ
jgi:hypothetical protein